MADVNDKFLQVSSSDTGRPVIAILASPGKALGATSINVNDTTNWGITTAATIAIYNTIQVAGKTIKDTTTQTEWTCTIAGTTISNLVLTGGSDQQYFAGAYVELTPTSAWAKRLYDGLVTNGIHNANGSLKDGAIGTSSKLADSIITTTKIADGAITQSKIATNVFATQFASKDGTPTITSPTYADASDGVVSMTIVVGSSGRLLVTFGATFYNDTASGRVQKMAYAVGGANTISAGGFLYNELTYKSQSANGDTSLSRTVVHTGLTAGDTTFTLKHLSGNDGGNRVYGRFIQAVLLP